MNTLSYSFIEEIVEVFMNQLTILSFFSPFYREKYHFDCITFLKKYINQSKNVIISDILRYYASWDIYSSSVLFLHLFTNISNVFSLKETFLNQICIELAKNIVPDPAKRENLNDLLKMKNKLFNNDWTFVDTLDNKQMEPLLNILNK
jgi:hypothetical protein